MQLANWISTTNIPWMAKITPDWAGVWFSIFPNWETVAAQAVAFLVVVGSYLFSGRFVTEKAHEHDHA